MFFLCVSFSIFFALAPFYKGHKTRCGGAVCNHTLLTEETCSVQAVKLRINIDRQYQI